MKTEIAPLLIVTKLEQYDYAGATAIAVVMLLVVVRRCCWRSTCCQWLERRRLGAERLSDGQHRIDARRTADAAAARHQRARRWSAGC